MDAACTAGRPLAAADEDFDDEDLDVGEDPTRAADSYHYSFHLLYHLSWSLCSVYCDST